MTIHIHVNFQFIEFLCFKVFHFLSTPATHLRSWTMSLTRTSEKPKPESIICPSSLSRFKPWNSTLFLSQHLLPDECILTSTFFFLNILKSFAMCPYISPSRLQLRLIQLSAFFDSIPGLLSTTKGNRKSQNHRNRHYYQGCDPSVSLLSPVIPYSGSFRLSPFS